MALYMGIKNIFNRKILYDTILSHPAATTDQLDMAIQILKEDQNIHMAVVHGQAQVKLITTMESILRVQRRQHFIYFLIAQTV